MLIGYARISTSDQSLDLQKDALKVAGCKKIFSEIASGAKSQRVELEKALEYVRQGDTLVVWRLDRLGRTLKHLIEFINEMEAKGIGFMSLQENIDTTTSGGKLIFHIFGALAEFERNIIRERTKAGLESARARGKLGGRPKKLDESAWKLAKKLYDEQELTLKEICKIIGVSKTSFYKYLRGKHKKQQA